jgi:FkbM family methyltransferase
LSIRATRPNSLPNQNAWILQVLSVGSTCMSTFAREEATCFLNAASVRSHATPSSLFSGRSFSGEESLLLPTLYRAARLALGTGSFVELGALDGVTGSNTIIFERCLGWRGLLIEANPSNFNQLAVSKRRSVKLHSAVCNHSGTVLMTEQGGPISGQPDAIQNSSLAQLRTLKRYNMSRVVEVPCHPLPSLMAKTNMTLPTTFLSLDVEGAEVQVLRTIDPLAFKVIMVEVDNLDAQQRKLVHEMLLGGGMHLAARLSEQIPHSEVFLAPGVDEMLLLDDPKRANDLGLTYDARMQRYRWNHANVSERTISWLEQTLINASKST